MKYRKKIAVILLALFLCGCSQKSSIENSKDLWKDGQHYCNIHCGEGPLLLVNRPSDCAATALKHVPKGENRPRLAIEAARRYADNPTEENRQAARAAAWAAEAEAAARAAAWAAEAEAAARAAEAGAAARAAEAAAWAAEAGAAARAAEAEAAAHKRWEWIL